MIGSTYAHAGVVAAMLIMLTACGADDSGGTHNTSGGDNVQEQSSGSEPTDIPAVSTVGTGRGTIEIGDFRHDFTVVGCTTLAGAMNGRAVSVSEPDNVDATFEFQPEDWTERDASEGWSDAATIRVDIEDAYLQLVTGTAALKGYNLPAGFTAQEIKVTNFDISDDGQSVTGEAQFIELNALLAGTSTQTTKGTFAFSCPAKR